MVRVERNCAGFYRAPKFPGIGGIISNSPEGAVDARV
jgi:hypothetical protein